MTLPTPGPDRTCLVTGASAGIGVELSRQLAARGHGVTLVARREERLKVLADELSTAHGIRAEVVTTDLTDAGARSALVETVAQRGLTVDVLVNNAGLSTTGPVASSDVDAELRMIRTDVEAIVHLCSALVSGMVARGRGAVLNVASTAAFQPLPGQAGYAASKAFVLAYTRALAQELRSTGVTATVLCPGPVETEFAEVAGFGDLEAGDALPKIMWVSAPDVARAAIDGLDKGRDVVIPGPANRVMAQLAQHTPRRVLLPILARQHPSLKR